MGSLLRYLVIALFIVLAASWLFTVAKSCNAPKTINSTLNDTGLTNADAADAENASEEENFDDLYIVEESDVKDGNADSSSDEEALPDYSTAADDLEEGNANDPEDDPLAVRGPDDSVSSSSNGSTFGKYLVVAGSYLTEANAQIMANQLRSLGYHAAEVISFDLSQYYSVTTGRYEGLGEARRIAREVKGNGMEAYVHKMRGKKMNR